MNLPTIQIPYYFTDQRHSGYADAVMAGKVSSANFVFVSDVEDIAPILPEEPDLRLGSPEHFLGAFMAALAKPENLKALPHIIAFWQDRRLAPLSLLAEAYLGVGLQKYARDAQVPQQRTLYRQAVAKLKREIAKNASPVTPQALELLCLWPDIAAQKLGLLVEGADYSPVLAKLGFTGTARNIAAFLLKNGFARNLRAITGYLLPLLETLQETAGKAPQGTAGKTSPEAAGKAPQGTAHNTLPPEKLTLGAAAEIALANGVSELVRRRENLDSSDYRDLSRCLHRIRPGVALNIFLKLIGADLVTETRHVMEMRTNREIVVHSPDTVFSDIRRLAEKRQDPQMNLKIAAALYDVALPRENYELPQLAAVLLAQPQKRPEGWNTLLGFARHVLQDCNASSQQLYRCLCAVALKQRRICRYGGSCRIQTLGRGKSRSLALRMGSRTKRVPKPRQLPGNGQHGVRRFLCRFAPFSGLEKIAARPVARHGSETAGPPGSGRNHRRPPLRGKTGFSAEGRFGKTRRMGACPSRSLARNAALTGDAFTRCPDRCRFYLLPRYRASPRTRLFPQPRHPALRLQASHSVARPGCFRSPGALLFPAPHRAGFFLSTMQKNTCIFKLT